MSIDFTCPPASPAQLAALRERFAVRRADVDRKARWASAFMFAGLVVMVIGTAIVAIGAGQLPFVCREALNEVPAGITGIAWLFVGMCAAVSITDSYDEGLAFTGVGMLTILCEPPAARWVQLFGAVLIVLTGLLAQPVFARDEDLHATADALDPLDHNAGAQACEQFAQWCEDHETLRTYQHELAAMGRHPTLGEYRAAEAWIAEFPAREAHQRARAACGRLDDRITQPEPSA